MNVLISNDDGLACEGIKILYEELKKNHQVYVLCPSKNMSGVSHSLEMNRSMRVEKQSQWGENVYAIDGSPCDCVITALCSPLFKDVKFDCVISGCNKGANLGTDIIFSGTCAAAREGALLGYPSIALSLYSKNNVYEYEKFVSKIAENLEALVSFCNEDSFLNINAWTLSSLEKDDYEGFKEALLCKRIYNDKVELVPDAEGNYVTKFIGSYADANYKENSDFLVAKNGFIAVTLVNCEYDSKKIGDAQWQKIKF